VIGVRIFAVGFGAMIPGVLRRIGYPMVSWAVVPVPDIAGHMGADFVGIRMLGMVGGRFPCRCHCRIGRDERRRRSSCSGIIVLRAGMPGE